MEIEVEAVRDGPDYAPAVRVTLSETPNPMPWEPQTVHIFGLNEARELFGGIGQALETIEANNG